MEKIFRNVRELIATGRYDELKNLDIPKPETFNWVKDIFEGIHVTDTPNAPALIWTDGDHVRRFTYSDLNISCNRSLNYLRGQGIVQGDIVFSQLSLQPFNWIALLAVIKGGYRLVPAATILDVKDIAYRFETLTPAVIISDSANAEKIDLAEAASGVRARVKIIVDGIRSGWTSLREIKVQSGVAPAAATKPDDPLFLFFTSGTTGKPKIVTHSHLSYPVGHLTTASWIGLQQTDVHYNISQPGWGKFAWSSFFAPWSVGAAVFTYQQEGRFDAALQLQQIEKHKITTFCAPPTVLRMLVLEDLKQYNFSFRQCVAAGEPLNPEIIVKWKEGTGILIRDGFGQTESTCMVANLPDTDVRSGSMGKPTFLYDVVIADEDGNELAPGEEGVITVRMTGAKINGIFTEYFGDPEKKKEVFRHGLYYTGDKAYRDEDGYIWFVGRNDDVIKSSDYRIGPFEVESMLAEHPAVVESAVVGTPHPIKGLEVKAFIILKNTHTPGAELAEQIFTFSRKQIAPYKMPRIIEFVESLPKTISGKIKRFELRVQELEHKTAAVKKEHEYFYK